MLAGDDLWLFSAQLSDPRVIPLLMQTKADLPFNERQVGV